MDRKELIRLAVDKLELITCLELWKQYVDYGGKVVAAEFSPRISTKKYKRRIPRRKCSVHCYHDETRGSEQSQSAIAALSGNALVFHILIDENFIIKEYLLRKSLLFNLIPLFILAFIINFWTGRKIYLIMKEKPFAIVTNDRLILDFGKYSLSWDSIQLMNIECERKLTVIYEDKKRKKRICDLKWLSRKNSLAP